VSLKYLYPSEGFDATRQNDLGLDLGLEAENAVAFSPDLREAQVRPSYAFGE